MMQCLCQLLDGKGILSQVVFDIGKGLVNQGRHNLPEVGNITIRVVLIYFYKELFTKGFQ